METGGETMKKEMERVKIPGSMRRDESGQVIVLIAFAAVFLIGMVALAVDISHGLVVRHELQNAADASALAGAGNLFPGPNWDLAEGVAQSSITWNKSDGESLLTCTAASGYWDLTQTTPGLQGRYITPTPQDVPAVMVTVSKTDGQNGGPVKTWFARIFGIDNMAVQAQAVAVISGPGYALPGSVFPITISKTYAETWREHSSSSDLVTIYDTYHSGPEDAGQWTTLLTESTNTTEMREMLENGNEDRLNINTSGSCLPGNPYNDCIYISAGVETTLYDSPSPNQEDVFNHVGETVLLPIVGDELFEAANEWAPVVGFIAFTITGAVGGDTKTITGYFNPDYIAPNTGGSGPYYGTLPENPLHLVK
jgi:hypothetical protein